jgi:predicted enzyme related to lactoylglutathione lyase
MTTTTAVRPTVATWFEIPADDFERAIRFYESILGTTLKREQFGPEILAIFPYEPPGISGAVVARPGESSATGPLLFLNADGRLEAALAAVPAAGGRVLTGKTDLPPGMGSYAVIRDPEGNRVGLHAIS